MTWVLPSLISGIYKAARDKNRTIKNFYIQYVFRSRWSGRDNMNKGDLKQNNYKISVSSLVFMTCVCISHQ